jgi:tetratricopeptide (TPR) repeat protein
VDSSPFVQPGHRRAVGAPIVRDSRTPARFAKAVAFHQSGRFDRAIALYRQILGREPDLPEVHSNLGSALASAGRHVAAEQSYRCAVELAPGDAQAWCRWGVALARGGRLEEAEAKLRRAIMLDGGSVEAHAELGDTLRRLGRLDSAEAVLRRAVALDPNRADAIATLGSVLTDLGRPHEAAAAFMSAIALKRDFAGAYNNLSLALKEVGRLAEAADAAERAIRLAPRRAAYYANLAEVRTFAVDDPHVAAMEVLAQDPSLTSEDAIHLPFALAKAYEDAGRYDDAFAQWMTGNARKRRAIAYDEAATLDRMARTRALFTPDLIAAHAGAGEPTRLPVFVVGMPRSARP